MSIGEYLHQVQKDLNAPKNQRNNFGNYNYRSCEDILEGLKKVMPEGFYVTLSDDVHFVEGRVYVKATATFTDGDRSVSTTAYARESLSKKGMDDSQITGSTSSYARKYALNGLFLIDDNKDADSMDNSDHQTQTNNMSELLKVMTDGDDIATAQYWRSLSQEEQQIQWNTIDKESQKALKSLLQEVKVS